MFNRIADQFAGKTAVVIGAGGIGAEFIRLLAGNVGKLVVGDRDDSMLDRLRSSNIGGQLVARNLDVQDPGAVSDFFGFVAGTVASPHFLFYTAGILTIEPFVETNADAWARAVNINLNGAFYCTKAAAELMIPERRGSIVLLGSIAGTKARSGSRVNPVYNTTKAGLAAFVNAAAIQLRGHGVRINCVSPGPTATRMMDIQPRQVHQSVCEMMLDERMNSPVEVAEVAMFVAAHGRFTGEDISMGGGAGLGG